MNIVVLGAGLMGRLLSWQLARRGHAVTVYEAGQPDARQSAARAAAAMLAPLAESAVADDTVVHMGVHGLKRWPELLAELETPVFFQQLGTLVVWHRQDAAEAQRMRLHLERLSQRLPNLPQAQSLDAQALAQMEPNLSHFRQAIYLPGEGQLDNQALLEALLGALAKLGVQMHWGSARVPQDFKPGQAGQPDWLFDCRGLGAQAQCPGLRGVRGEVLTLHAPHVSLQRPTRLLHPRYPLYIAPKTEGIFRVGATEIESEDNSPMSVRSALELLSAAYTVDSGFGEARIVEMITQCRPTLPDNQPQLCWLGPRSLQLNGLYRHGYMIAPAMLDIALELFDQGQSALAQPWATRIMTDPMAAQTV
jgi:glycine oxidase